MSLAQKYLNGLKQAHDKNGLTDEWSKMQCLIQGASDDDICQLKESYPLIPQSLIEILKFANGTIELLANQNHDFNIRIFGYGGIGDVDFDDFYMGACLIGFPRLFSCQNIEYVKSHIKGELVPPWGFDIDEKVTDNAERLNWLFFATGGYENQPADLYIDFTPSDKGKVGQIVAYYFYGEEIRVIADGFDGYLQGLMNANYPFIDKN